MCRSAESQESKLNLLLTLEHGPNYDIIENYSLTRECYNAGRNTALMHIHQPEDHLNAMGSEQLQTSASMHSTLVFFAAEVLCLCHVPAVLSVPLFPLACGGLSDTTSSLALKKKKKKQSKTSPYIGWAAGKRNRGDTGPHWSLSPLPALQMNTMVEFRNCFPRKPRKKLRIHVNVRKENNKKRCKVPSWGH